MPNSMINIGEASRRTGLTARAIRLYEASGIVRASQRGGNGYRRFNEHDIRTLKLIRGARMLGFDLESIRQLVGYWRTGPETRSEVARLLGERISEIRRCEAEMREVRSTLESTLTDANDEGHWCKLLELLLGADAAGNMPAASAPGTRTAATQVPGSKGAHRPAGGLRSR